MNICVIRFSSLGDVVLTQPIAAWMRETYPEATITYVTKPATRPIVEMFGCVDRVVEWRNDPKAAANEIGSADICVDLQGKVNSHLLRRALGAKRSYVYKKRHMTRWAIVHHFSGAAIDSTLELYATALHPLGLAAPLPYPRLFPTDDAHRIDELFVDYGVAPSKTLVGVFPGARHATKRYPPEQFACFINSVPETWNCQFLLCGGPDDKSAALEVLKHAPGVIDLTGATDTGDLVRLIDRLGAVISNDSGPMHVAAALGKPQIALFGATHPRLGFRPLNRDAVVLSSDLNCQPCSLHGGDKCPRGHFRCLRGVRPATLLQQFQSLLENRVWRLG